MKIRPPVPGRTTATLVEYKYSPKHQRTMPVRLGSFNIKTDPDTLPRGVSLAKGQALDDESLQAIRAFLVANPPPKFSAELVEQCRAQLLLEGLPSELHGGSPYEHQSALDLLASTLQDARRDLVERAQALAAQGDKLTSKRSLATASSAGDSRLDALQAHANLIRRVLTPAFEAACKEAGLMVNRRGKRTEVSASAT